MLSFMQEYYIGAHHPEWLWNEGPDFPMCVSRRWLAPRKTLGRARQPWILDSGGYSELSKIRKGECVASWSITEEQYVHEVARFQAEIGMLQWAAPMDHMCEPNVRTLTGKTVEQHQDLTVENFVYLRTIWSYYYSDRPCPIIPVIQGWSVWDYIRCVEKFQAAGVDLHEFPTVGVGTICRRNSPIQIAGVVNLLAGEGLPLHVFGCQLTGLSLVADKIKSGDSMSWSLDAKHNPPVPEHQGRHPHCQNCREYAREWYCEHVLDKEYLAA